MREAGTADTRRTFTRASVRCQCRVCLPEAPWGLGSLVPAAVEAEAQKRGLVQCAVRNVLSDRYNADGDADAPGVIPPTGLPGARGGPGARDVSRRIRMRVRGVRRVRASAAHTPQVSALVRSRCSCIRRAVAAVAAERAWRVRGVSAESGRQFETVARVDRVIRAVPRPPRPGTSCPRVPGARAARTPLPGSASGTPPRRFAERSPYADLCDNGSCCRDSPQSKGHVFDSN